MILSNREEERGNHMVSKAISEIKTHLCFKANVDFNKIDLYKKCLEVKYLCNVGLPGKF